jgi:2-polyprenyl-3-methyl-5-hydroxy-6-metoxy-1,4-benzoquinol methylase
MTNDQDYADKLHAEAAHWGSISLEQAETTPPDWTYHRRLRHNRLIHGATIDALLDQIQPGMRALELGCASGWLTLAMAQRGADATGVELSEDSLAVARGYYARVRGQVAGSVTYQQADVNTIELEPDAWDVIAVKGTLHHLVNVQHVIEQIAQGLKPGGLLWVDDSEGDEHIRSVLAAGALCFVLPTHTSYRDKLRALLRFGAAAPSRVRASIQAEGLSPFEGISREQSWRQLIAGRFILERVVPHPSFTGYVSAQVRLPDRVALPILYLIRAVDRVLTRLGIVRNTGWILFARKPAAP